MGLSLDRIAVRDTYMCRGVTAFKVGQDKEVERVFYEGWLKDCKISQADSSMQGLGGRK